MQPLDEVRLDREETVGLWGRLALWMRRNRALAWLVALTAGLVLFLTWLPASVRMFFWRGLQSHAVLASMIVAEQYFSFDSLTARSTWRGSSPRPAIVYASRMRVKTFGSTAARSASASTTQSATGCLAFFRISTTSKAVQAAAPASTSSMGRGPRSRPPCSGAPSMTSACPLPVSPTNDMPSVHLIRALMRAPRVVSE